MSAAGSAAVAVIVGSSFAAEPPGGLHLEPRLVETAWGPVTLHRVVGASRGVHVLLRHGWPHRADVPIAGHLYDAPDVPAEARREAVAVAMRHLESPDHAGTFDAFAAQ